MNIIKVKSFSKSFEEKRKKYINKNKDELNNSNRNFYFAPKDNYYKKEMHKLNLKLEKRKSLCNWKLYY